MRPDNYKTGVLPIGKIPDIILKIIAANVETHFHNTTEILKPEPVPSYAFDMKRSQYNAGGIIKKLNEEDEHSHDKIIAVCDVDIFIPILTHVFGEAEFGGKHCIASLFRLRQGGKAPCPASIYYERAAKVAIHEAGHLFNLLHCENTTCLMHFAGNLKQLDTISLRFCPNCQAQLKNLSLFSY